MVVTYAGLSALPVDKFPFYTLPMRLVPPARLADYTANAPLTA